MTLHACLGTCPKEGNDANANNHHNNDSTNVGRMLTVGRKDCDVCLPEDKSVSRRHVSIHFVSSSSSSKKKSVPGGVVEGRGACRTATTLEQTAACKKNPFELCLVATDSSKFGTFLVEDGTAQQEEEAIQKAKAAAAMSQEEEDDGETTAGDETEDEASTAQQQQQGSRSKSTSTARKTSSSSSNESLQLSAAARSLVQYPLSATLRKLESETVLPDPTQQPNRQILLQCGQNGTTIRLTHVSLNLCWTSLDDSTKDLWGKRLRVLGATLLERPGPDMDLLLANERKANAKQICAWLLQKPAVTTTFLQTLWERTSPADAMPDATTLPPPPNPNKTSFFLKKPNHALYQDCTYLSLVDNDMECLCRAAGCGAVEALHECRTEKQFDARMRQLKKEQQVHWFFVPIHPPPTAKVKTRQNKLLTQYRVPHLTHRSLARHVTHLEPLVDAEHGTPIVPSENDDDDGGGKASASASASTTPRKESTEMGNVSDPPQSEQLVEPSDEDDNDDDEEVLEGGNKGKGKGNKDSAEALEAIPEEPSVLDESPSMIRDTTTTSTTTQMDATLQTTMDTSLRDTSTSELNTSTASTSTWISTKKRGREEDDNTASSASQKRRIMEEQDGEDPTTGMPNNDDQEEPPEVHASSFAPRTTNKLPQTSDGWLVAPRGKERRQYRATDEELKEAMGVDELPPKVVTEYIVPTVAAAPALVVEESSDSRRRNSNAARTKSGCDFKKFRKNRLCKTYEGPPIDLRLVLPRESQVQQALGEQNRLMQEEQRIADSLFGGDADAVGKAGGTRRKRR